MAVDFFHRLIVRGSQADVRAFGRRIYRQYPRSIGKDSWTEIAPFSFAALYEIAPAARRVESEIPADPYELCAWPVRRIGRNKAEIRYQFQTRNLEMVGLIRALSQALPSLTFTLATLCLDDSEIEAYRLKGGRMKKWIVPEDRRDFYWDRAPTKFGLAGEEAYDNEDAEHWVEEEMLHEALNHWDNGGNRRHSRRRAPTNGGINRRCAICDPNNKFYCTRSPNNWMPLRSPAPAAESAAQRARENRGRSEVAVLRPLTPVCARRRRN